MHAFRLECTGTEVYPPAIADSWLRAERSKGIEADAGRTSSAPRRAGGPAEFTKITEAILQVEEIGNRHVQETVELTQHLLGSLPEGNALGRQLDEDAALDRYTAKRAAWMDEVLSAPTARDVAERMLMGTADSQTDPDNPPGCLLVQGGLACGTGSENVPFELAARRALTEDQLRERFARAKK
jgi:hypothetical protein